MVLLFNTTLKIEKLNRKESLTGRILIKETVLLETNLFNTCNTYREVILEMFSDESNHIACILKAVISSFPFFSIKGIFTGTKNNICYQTFLSLKHEGKRQNVS